MAFENSVNKKMIISKRKEKQKNKKQTEEKQNPTEASSKKIET
jgi:hypothetical protein